MSPTAREDAEGGTASPERSVLEELTGRTYDTLHIGRSSIDLYSNDVGTRFEEIKSFAAYVGGSPTNISVGVRRLGLKTALVTGLGTDPVGDFVVHFLTKNGVDTRFSPRKPGHRTSAVVLGIEPPDRFPYVYYRENCADIELTIDDVIASPISDTRVLQFAGTNLTKEPSRSATLFAAEVARNAGTQVVLDLDFRPDQWHDPRAFGAAMRSALRVVDIVVGTEDEIEAAGADPRELRQKGREVHDCGGDGEMKSAISSLLSLGPRALVEKRGERGARGHLADGTVVTAGGFPVEIYNVVGAGDAFCAGFLYGYVKGWGLYDSLRLGNACGAIVVTKHGCANFMPTYDEVMAFVNEHGGL